jgi:DNA-binding beta-propeller fold protein YncE
VHDRLFCVCHITLMIVTDAKTGRQVASRPIGAYLDAVAFDPAMNLAFSSNGDSANVIVVNAGAVDRFMTVDTVATERGAHPIALDVLTHRDVVPALVAAKFQVPALTPALEPPPGIGNR